MDKISYKSGYKYQLTEEYELFVRIRISHAISFDYASLYPDGKLWVRKGYAWDGPSGPAVDTPNFMRGSLVHDVLYQMMRLGLLDVGWRKDADRELYRICREDGMSWTRAKFDFYMIRVLGKKYTFPSEEPTVIVAP
jgi:hypothetical protein